MTVRNTSSESIWDVLKLARKKQKEVSATRRSWKFGSLRSPESVKTGFYRTETVSPRDVVFSSAILGGSSRCFSLRSSGVIDISTK